MKQVDKDHYSFKRYCYPDRWASYYYQIREVIACEPQTMLEVGVGEGVLKQYVKENTTISYTNVDVAQDLNPDVIGSVDTLPFQDNSYDMVCAFEVLEHLPFDSFEKCIREIARVSRRHILVSLPHFGPAVKCKLKLPFLPEITVAFKVPFPKQHVFNGEHHWEIGKRGYPVSRIKKVLQKHCVLKKDFVPFENQYHHFFVLEKK